MTIVSIYYMKKLQMKEKNSCSNKAIKFLDEKNNIYYVY